VRRKKRKKETDEAHGGLENFLKGEKGE